MGSGSQLNCIRIRIPAQLYTDPNPSSAVHGSESQLSCVRIRIPAQLNTDQNPSSTVYGFESQLSCIRIRIPAQVYTDPNPSSTEYGSESQLNWYGSESQLSCIRIHIPAQMNTDTIFLQLYTDPNPSYSKTGYLSMVIFLTTNYNVQKCKDKFQIKNRPKLPRIAKVSLWHTLYLDWYVCRVYNIYLHLNRLWAVTFCCFW